MPAQRSRTRVALLCALALAASATAATSRAASLTAKDEEAPPNTSDDAKKKNAEEHANDQIRGIKFGVGIAGTWGAERIQEAQVVDGTVRVTKGQRGTPGFWLETHLLVPVKRREGVVKHTFLNQLLETEVDNKAAFGIGPFLGVQSSTDNVLDAMAGGIMVGFRRPGSASDSLNIGVGVAIDPHFQVLGDGLAANSPLPGNETAVRYRTKSQSRLIVMFSFAF